MIPKAEDRTGNLQLISTRFLEGITSCNINGVRTGDRNVPRALNNMCSPGTEGLMQQVSGTDL